MYKGTKYRPEIDGLRAIALLPVILFHAEWDVFAGGFVGVDVFFVISGYLITSILMRELEEGRFSIVRFYERRARRILPALLTVCLACIPFAWVWMVPGEMRDFAQGLVAIQLFSSNILFWMESDYFATAADLNPLLHTWSLAVEEQFYLIFPLLFVLLYRFPRVALTGVLALLTALSLGASQIASAHSPEANFFLLPTRAWELGIGVLLAVTAAPDRFGFTSGRLRAEVGGVVGLGAIVGSVLFFDSLTPFPSLWALFPVLGSALVIVFADPRTTTGRLLSSRAFVGLGLVSYSGYLWHQPLEPRRDCRRLS